MNPGTFAVSAVLVIIVGLIIYKMIKDKKSGNSSCSCGGSCSGCGMAGSCHKSGKSGSIPDGSVDQGSETQGLVNVSQIEDRNVVKKITMKIDGMMCGMCESHVNDAIRSNLNVRKLKTSHSTGLSEFLTNDVVSDESLKKIIEKTGYRVLDIKREYIQE